MNDTIARLMLSGSEDFSRDEEYRRLTENADDCIKAVAAELTDSEKLRLLLSAIEQCHSIERQYSFIDGIKIGFELRRILP